METTFERLMLASAVLVACGSTSSSHTTPPTSPPSSVVADEGDVAAVDERRASVATPYPASEADPNPIDEEDEERVPGLKVRIEASDGAASGTYEHQNNDVVLAMRLGDREVAVRVSSNELDNLQDGNGSVFSIEIVSVSAGALVLTHHNIDTFVDPPRFSDGRWSEAWWFPADLRTGEYATPIGGLGEQYVDAMARDDGSICISDALGDVRRVVVEDGGVMNADAVSCERRVAEQPESVFRRVGSGWDTADDYLAVHRALRLRRNLYALQVAWSDDGQYLEGEQVPELPSTRLVWVDVDGHLHWYYLNMTAYCDAHLHRDEITCGDHRFQFDAGTLVALPSSTHILVGG